MKDEAIRRHRCRSESAIALVASLLLCGCESSVREKSAPTTAVSLIPAPAQVESRPGQFLLLPSTPVLHDSSPGAESAAGQFAEFLARTRGPELPFHASAGGPRPDALFIEFRLSADEGMRGTEGYSLSVSPQRIVVSARSPRGLFYGGVTLWQLATAGTNAVDGAIAIPALEIKDAPRFPWRGILLDVARHYMPPADIRRLIDQMALHKLNTLHWHLTDDQGWRLEIRKYPRLTEVGAWRVPAGAAGRDAAGNQVRYGGFYTQDEVRDLVRYAARRHVTIVPEIDMPGHMQAAIASYPALGTDPRHSPSVSPDWGIHTHLLNVEEDTFTFVENVLSEVIDLFPGEYIHVGGDEALKDRWEASARVQQRMRELGVKDEKQLQGYFLGRVAKFLESRGRRLVGWDEILESQLPENATVMSWRGVAGAIEAAKLGHDVIMAVDPVLYMDHLQSDSPDEPPGRPSLITLAEVYAFEPVPAGMPATQANHVVGAQVNAWTEHMRTTERVEHALFPRAAAIAEVTWSPASKRNLDDFLARLQPQLARYDALGIRYARTALQPHVTAERLKGAQPLRRRDEEMKVCSNKLALHLEDDAPADGERAIFLVDIMDPCWIFERAPLDGVTRIAVTVGQVPYNFQLWKDRENVVIRPESIKGGALELHLDTCDGRTLARLPLASVSSNTGLTELVGVVPAPEGVHDVCLWFGTGSIDPLWVIDSVEFRSD